MPSTTAFVMVAVTSRKGGSKPNGREFESVKPTVSSVTTIEFFDSVQYCCNVLFTQTVEQTL